ncbi:uncharacterized protein [Choristoneura fumiferana]|uniref:uncharacterized protein n=1 Tax=Choristoneura fumiferana TaxID=7141 RepID=UPI003D15D0E6
MSAEEIAISYVLAHTSQFDMRVHRLAHTTELKSRNQLLKELKSFSSMKRKHSDNDSAPDIKRFKYSTSGSFKCHHCGKLGHKAIDCRQRKMTNFKPTTTFPTTTQNTVNVSSMKTEVKKQVICFRCGEKGHIASHCTKTGSSGSGGGAGSAGAAQQQRRVDTCEIRGACGTLQHSGTYEDV